MKFSSLRAVFAPKAKVEGLVCVGNRPSFITNHRSYMIADIMGNYLLTTKVLDVQGVTG